MTTSQVSMLVSAVAQLLGVLIWPLVMLFFLVRFPGPEVSQLCDGGVPGREHGVDLIAGGLSWATAGKSGGDQGPAELYEHVLEGGL